MPRSPNLGVVLSFLTRAHIRIRRSTALFAAVLLVAGAMTAGSVAAPTSSASAAGTASISGTVTAPDDAPSSWLEGTNVYAYRVGGGSFVATTQVDPTGAYTLTGVPSGKIAVEFRPSYGSDLIAEYWDGGARIEDATAIPVADGTQVGGINAHLEHGAWFSGTLDMAALRSAHPGNDRYTLWLTSADGRDVVSTYSERLWYDTMDFSFPGLRPGTYRLAVGTHLLDGMSTLTSPLSSVQFVRVGSGSAVTLGEREQLRSLALKALPLPSRISGTIAAAGLTLSGVTDVGAVRLYERDGEDWVQLPGYAQDILYQKSVAYSVALTPGEYAVGFESINRAIPAADEWWTGASTITEATSIDLASGEHRAGIDGGIAPIGASPATRLAGPNRFATSAAVSAASFSPGVAVAYVANGWKFPDALSGAAAAGVLGGPVLLTDEESLPGVIHDELDRLKPQKIVILGSEASVQEGVAKSLSQYSTDVKRVAGEDRFATSAAVSAASFSPGVPVAYLANGWKFPDALAGAAPAGTLGGPVLLTDGESLPAAIATELARLKPAKIVLLGSAGSVSESVRTAARTYTATVERLAGADRFETSAAVSRSTFAPGVPVVYLTNGWKFPDALSGAAAAGSLGGPVLLTNADSLPASIAAELARLKPKRIVVLGDESSVADLVRLAARASAR